jgi:hypothetical protein
LESTDAGKSWSNVSDQVGAGKKINDITDPRKIPFYLATNHGLYVKVN